MHNSRLRAKLTTGIATLVIGFVGIGVVAAPAAAAGGRSLPAGSSLYALSCDEGILNPQLFSIDAATAGATAIGAATSEENACAGQPAWNPLTSTAYFVSWGPDTTLGTVDLTTGASATVAPFTFEGGGERVDSLAIGLDGAAFAISGDELFTVDLTTGELAEVGQLGVVGLYGFAVDPTTGDFFAISPEGLLYSVDVTTGAATLVGDTGLNSGSFNAPFSLQIDSAGILWIEGDSFEPDLGFVANLWSVDPADLSSSSVLSGAIAVGEDPVYSEALLFVPAPVKPVVPVAPVVEPAVVVAPVAPQLANTGVDAAPIAAGGALVALLGLALLAPAIRRRAAR
ncbi:DUF6923 family protein [Agreia bicolorata]|uniref:DUF6923 domain-containing protein n=1 Tax=Agreia bicolorata TaxID=110935 RepID=A0ABR5CBS6_9MICO|nr:hypothetical protein [Agreia bicolorata]KJC62977.1 hypothetical protein TZ00_17595 [Agreia bicolorata]